MYTFFCYWKPVWRICVNCRFCIHALTHTLNPPFCFSEAIAPFGQTMHPVSTSPPLAQINVCLTRVLLAARWEAPKEQFKTITSILFGHGGEKNHKKSPSIQDPEFVLMWGWRLGLLWPPWWDGITSTAPQKNPQKTAAVQIAHRFLICPCVRWMSLVSVPPRQHTSVHTVYCTTLGNDPCSRFGKCAWVGICWLHRALWSSVKWEHWLGRPPQTPLRGLQRYTPVRMLPLAGPLPMFWARHALW